MPTDARTPASTRRESARSRWRGGAVPGSVRRHTSRVERRHRERHRHVGALRRLDEHVDVAHDQRAARDQRERVRGLGEHLEAGARQAVAALGRLVRVGRGADRDRLARPRAARELAPQHVGDVDLDADRGAVALVRRAVGAQLEGADVTERAAVRAAHVRVERPAERHALHAVERDLARLLAVLRPHRRSIEHMFVRVGSRPRPEAPDRSATLRAAWTTTYRPVPARRAGARR